MKVSVIIPVYNVKPYLERCVQSVLRQTHKDLEIIMVDDGSTDGSGELAEQLSIRDSRIQVIHQENQGLSGARNTGLRVATGDYVVFLDSDDEWLLDDGIETLMKQDGVDLIIFNPVHIWKEHRERDVDHYDIENISTLPNAQAVFSYLVKTQQFNMSACPMLVRRQVLIQHEIFFPLGYISEDVYWSLHLWQHVSTVKVCNLDFYGYHHREDSITQTTTLRVYDSYDKLFSYWKEQCENHCVNSNAIRIYLANLWVSLGYSYHLLDKNNKPAAIAMLDQHKDLLCFATTPKSRCAALLVKWCGVKGAAILLGVYWRLGKKFR